MMYLLAFLAACSTPPEHKVVKKSGEPDVPEQAVIRLAFEHEGGTFEPGSGFIAKTADEKYVGVTAHHLFSPAGGLERELYAAEVPRFVKAVHAMGLDGRKLPDVGPMRYIPGAQVTVDKQDWTTDIAAFFVPQDYYPSALSFAAHNASPEDQLWLVVVPKTKGGARFHKLDVAISNKTLLFYRLLDADFDPHGASGSPVVNKKGEVVGMNTAEGNDGVNWWGSAHPVESMVTRLQTAQ